MPIEKCELKDYLSRCVNSAEKTDDVIQYGILLVTIIDYLANIDCHKLLERPTEDIRVSKKYLIKFVSDHFQQYIGEVNSYLRETGHSQKYEFDTFTATDLVGAFYRLKHAIYPYSDRGFEFTFYGKLGGIAVIMKDESRRQVCLNIRDLKCHIMGVIESYFDDGQAESVKKAIVRFCEEHDLPSPLGLFVLGY